MSVLGDFTSKDIEPAHAERVAERILLETLADGQQSLRVPVDLVKLAKKLGVQVRVARLHDHAPSLLAKESPQQSPIIYLDEDTSHIRQRFALAHELGHFVEQEALGHTRYDTLFEGRGDSKHSKSEQWANKFAAALLMPANYTKALYVNGKTTKEIAERFNVSSTAVAVRLAQMGLK